MSGKGKNVLIGWGYQARRKAVSPIEFFEDTHTTNTSEQVKEDVWVDWFFGAFVDQETTSYSVQSQDISLVYVRAVQISGGVSVNNQDISLKKDSNVSLSSVISVTGFDLSLNHSQDATISVSSDSISVTTNSFGLRYDKKVDISGSVGVSGNLGLLHNKKIPVSYNSISYSLNDVSISKGREFSVSTISYVVSGTVSFEVDYLVSVSGSVGANVNPVRLEKRRRLGLVRVKRKYWV